MTKNNEEVLLERFVHFFFIFFAEQSYEVFRIAGIGCDVAIEA